MSADDQPGEFRLVNLQGTEGTVILQETTPIVSPRGEPLSFEEISRGRSVTVDGYRPDPSTPTQLKGTLVIVETDLPSEETRISGTVQSVHRTSFDMLALGDEPPCPTVASMEIRVNVGAETDIYLVSFPAAPDDPPISRRIGLGELSPEQRVDVYGTCSSDGAVDAEDVIAYRGTLPDNSP